MTILFGTARTRFPDASTAGGGIAQLLNRTQSAIGGFLEAAGNRIFTNTFVEDGTTSVSGSSFIDSKFSDLVRPSRREIISQLPQATLLLKKRMFSTVRTNYDVRFMDEDEKIFLRAIKNLFRRKAEEIAFYENIALLEKVIQDPNFLNTFGALDRSLDAFFTVLNLGFGINESLGELGTLLAGSLRPSPKVLFRLKELQQRSKQNKFTTWITDPKLANFSGTGPGPGVIEFTWMTRLRTHVTLETGGGNCSVSIEDPYRLTRITETDIDLALKQSFSENIGSVGFFDVSAQEQLDQAQDLDLELNTIRRNRQVSEINFEYGPDGDPFATIININFSFNTSTINDIPNNEALAANEVTRVIGILNRLRSFKAIRGRAYTSVQNDNQNYGVIRQKMRGEFVGHHIFQQMDAIHIFANSFTRRQTPIYDNRADLLVNNNIEGLITSSDQRGKLSDEALEQERSVIAPEMSLYEYKVFRNPVEWRGTGPQIFSGLVKTVKSTYESRSGKFILNISAVDNIEFLELSRINTQPGLTQPQGALEDPITPYDIDVDETSGLIVDRKLSQTNARRLPFLKFDDGPFLGEGVENEDRLIQDTAQGVSSILAYQHVPGLTYKWKQGIISATQDVNVIRPLSRSRSILGDLREDFGVTLSTEPFANIDAADVLSILITGQPYNYNNFLENAIQASNYTIDNDTNNRTYFNFLFDFLERQNQILGGFIPAQRANIDPEIVANALREQRRLTNFTSRISDLQREQAKLQDKLSSLEIPSPDFTAAEPNTDAAVSQALANNIQSQIDQLNTQIGELSEELTNPSVSGARVQTFGDAVQVHYTDEDHKAVRKKLNYILKKKPEDVRYNQDKNYFIVSEKYQTDADIQAYVLNLKTNGFNLFESTYKNPREICEEVANIIDFEFFADSQGNIQFRPPEYNKTPLSLLMKMVELGQTDGISLAPSFLMKLMDGRDRLLFDKILEIELQIAEKSLLLGLTIDQFANSNGVNLALKPATGKTFTLDTVKLFKSLDYESIFNEANQTEVIFSPPKTIEERNRAAFDDAVGSIIAVRNQLIELRGSTSAPKDPDNFDDRQDVTVELNKYDVGSPTTYTNRVKITNDIAQLITRRQTLARVYRRMTEEKEALNAINSLGSNFSLFSGSIDAITSTLNGGTPDIPAIPRFLEELIEDDTGNFDGFNSGKRFIIEDETILSMDFEIRPPQFNRIDVVGTENLVGADVRGANALQYWAGATDFDSWRQFGYRAIGPVEKPFIQDPNTQGSLYAVFKLIQQKKRVHSGSITVIGNEFYQPGDVVYVNNRQMLYYVNSVSHDISLSDGSFRTTLDLTYGHPLGDYIPTPLDAIGKTMLADRRRNYGGIKANRTMVPSATVVHLGTLTYPLSSELEATSMQLEASTQLLVGSEDVDEGIQERLTQLKRQFKKQNFDRAKNAIQKAQTRINDSNQDIARIEIRGYYINTGAADHFRTNQFINATYDLLYESLPPDTVVNINDGLSLSLSGSELGFGVGSNSAAESLNIMKVPPINLEDKLDENNALLRRMPSSQAWAQSSRVQYNGVEGIPINSIDIVLVFDKSRSGDATSSSFDDAVSSATGGFGDTSTSLADEPLTGFSNIGGTIGA